MIVKLRGCSPEGRSVLGVQKDRVVAAARDPCPQCATAGPFTIFLSRMFGHQEQTARTVMIGLLLLLPSPLLPAAVGQQPLPPIEATARGMSDSRPRLAYDWRALSIFGGRQATQWLRREARASDDPSDLPEDAGELEFARALAEAREAGQIGGNGARPQTLPR